MTKDQLLSILEEDFVSLAVEEAVKRYPFAGSAMVVWDSDSPPPPTTNTAPRDGVDPHEDPRASPAARLQKAVFLTTGTVIDVCGPGPCHIPHALSSTRMSSSVLRTSGVGASDSSRVGREGRYGADLEATAEAVGAVAGPRHAPAALRSPERGGLRRP